MIYWLHSSLIHCFRAGGAVFDEVGFVFALDGKAVGVWSTLVISRIFTDDASGESSRSVWAMYWPKMLIEFLAPRYFSDYSTWLAENFNVHLERFLAKFLRLPGEFRMNAE